MTTHYIQFRNKNKKTSLIFVFFYLMNFVGTVKRVRINHDKRAIVVRAIEVRLHFPFTQQPKTHQ